MTLWCFWSVREDRFSCRENIQARGQNHAKLWGQKYKDLGWKFAYPLLSFFPWNFYSGSERNRPLSTPSHRPWKQNYPSFLKIARLRWLHFLAFSSGQRFWKTALEMRGEESFFGSYTFYFHMKKASKSVKVMISTGTSLITPKNMGWLEWCVHF